MTPRELIIEALKNSPCDNFRCGMDYESAAAAIEQLFQAQAEELREARQRIAELEKQPRYIHTNTGTINIS